MEVNCQKINTIVGGWRELPAFFVGERPFGEGENWY
jgi:hypothetical protein